MDKKVAVIGLGKSGIAASKLLRSKGAYVMAFDLKTSEEIKEIREVLEPLGVEVHCGPYKVELLEEVSLVVLSPGVNPQAPLWLGLKRRGTKVIGELELGYWFTDEPIVAVTGTNGKSTTTSLIGHILQSYGRKVFVGGNLGVPLCEYVLSGKKVELLVLEVSSFQLETIEVFRPKVSVFLNISDDHFDRHPNFEAYLSAKLRIFENQMGDDFAVLNRDDPNVWAISTKLRPQVIPFSKSPLSGEGVWYAGDRIKWRLMGKEGEIPFGGGLLGWHNLENVLASVAVGLVLGVNEGAMAEALLNFKPLPHRVEFVREFRGVKFYDDSKATNPHATLKALESMQGPVVLIAGGQNKGLDLKSLRTKVEKVRAVVAIGEAAPEVEEAFVGAVPVVRAYDMEDAVRKAFALSEPGDSVLLSPACASFDMFRDYKHRGEEFKRAVWKLGTD